MKNNNKKIQTKSKIYGRIRIFVLIIAGLILSYTSYGLTKSYLEYRDDEKKYAGLNDMFIKNVEIEDSVDDGDNGGKITSDESIINYTANEKEWVWDYDAMLKYNDEAKGYIKLDGTRIQYPILEHSDNEFYLNRGSDKVFNGAGSIFIDYRTAGLEGDLCIIYGHNMLDGSMFKDLMNFRDKSFCKKHPTFDIYVGHKHYIYYVFSVFSTKDVDDNIYKYGFESRTEFQNWINRVYNKSGYKFECDKPTVDDKIIMCSTCIDDNGNRQLVCMYRGQEVVD